MRLAPAETRRFHPDVTPSRRGVPHTRRSCSHEEIPRRRPFHAWSSCRELHIRYLIVDDHRLFADAVQRTLSREGLTDVAVVTSAGDARRAVVESAPDVVLVDIGVGDGDALELGRELLALRPETKLVAMTALRDRSLPHAAIRVGFHAFLPKDASADQLVGCIRSVLAGEVVAPGARLQQSSPEGPFAELTDREREVMALVAAGLPTQAMTERLGVSAHTVRSHVHSILRKLDLGSRLEVVSYAARHGLGPDGRMYQEN